MTEDPLLLLADELRDLGSRMLSTADQLSQRATATTPAPTPAAVPVPTPGPWQSAEAWVQRMDEVPPPQSEPKGPIWDRLGVRSIAWLGAAVTLLGAVLLLVLAIQRGWLGPVPRLLIGAAFAAVLLGAAPRVRRTSGGRVGSYALAGTGLAVCYLDVVAATALYHYVPAGVGLLLGLVVAVGGLWLADHWHSCALAVFVVLGAACLAPLCTHGATPLLVGFLLVLSGAASPVQLRRGWPWLTAAAGLPPVVAALYLDGNTQHYGGNLTATTALAVLTTVACLGLATLTALRRPADQASLGLLVIAPTPTMVAAALLTGPVASGLLAGVAALLLAVWVVRRLRPAWLPANFAAVAGGTGVAVLAQAATRAVPVDHLAVTLLGLAVVFALAAMWGQSRGTLLAGGLYALTGFVVALFHALPVTLLVSSPLFPPYPTTLVDAVTAGLLLVLTGLVFVIALLRLDPAVPTPVWAGIGLAGLYGSTGVVLCTTMLVADDRTGFLVGHVLVTVCWAVGALVLLAKGISRLPLRIAGLTLVGAAVAKLFLFDLAALDGLARAAVFLGAGIALLVAGVRYAQLVSGRRAE
jgi:uncharacterized membrane protein